MRRAVTAALMCAFVHTAHALIEQGAGPFYYLPKLEGHLEARLWNDVFSFAEERMALPAGSVRATVLIETIPAAFEMDEILFELREHASGLNAGRWDYLFSIIKVFRDAGPEFIVPDRASVAMTKSARSSLEELPQRVRRSPRAPTRLRSATSRSPWRNTSCRTPKSSPVAKSASMSGFIARPKRPSTSRARGS